jgi:hypothetical protein
LKGEFNPRFRGIFGTNWDKSATTAAPLLRESELAVLIETRKSRAIQTRDLVEVLYQNDGERAREDLRNLTAQGLIETKTPQPTEEQLLTITQSVNDFLRRASRKVWAKGRNTMGSSNRVSPS